MNSVGLVCVGLNYEGCDKLQIRDGEGKTKKAFLGHPKKSHRNELFKQNTFPYPKWEKDRNYSIFFENLCVCFLESKPFGWVEGEKILVRDRALPK